MKPVGTFGVDVFFVISGYVVARICATNSEFLFRRRVLRIVPPYWAATLALFVFTYFFPERSHFEHRSGGRIFYSRDISVEFVLGLVFFHLTQAVPEPLTVRIRAARDSSWTPPDEFAPSGIRLNSIST
jgi:peptidoglycan/LPS O-acetylase OafA/YrhL